jgi:hypoxanthine-DNA glycosylase
MIEFHPFKPIIFDDSILLILGTFPSFDSLKNNFYYGHRQNQFWKLLSFVFKEDEPKTIDEKLSFLKKYKVALWDMVDSCQRENSLDSSLKKIKINDIEHILKKYPNIKAIYFTGRKAQDLFEKHFSYLDIKRYYLPSPSPAYRKINFEEKLKLWKRLINLTL